MSRCRELITVITGPMYSGKTLLLLHKIAAAESTKRNVEVFKPKVDTRFGSYVQTRLGGKHEAISVDTMYEIVYRVEAMEIKPDLVAIDEVQFFSDDNNVSVKDGVLYLAEHGIEVAISGLPLDYRGEPFGHMGELITLATIHQKTNASCTQTINNGTGRMCSADAQCTQRLIDGEAASYYDQTVIIDQPGSKSEVTYTARCADHWLVKDLPKRVRFT